MNTTHYFSQPLHLACNNPISKRIIITVKWCMLAILPIPLKMFPSQIDFLIKKKRMALIFPILIPINKWAEFLCSYMHKIKLLLRCIKTLLICNRALWLMFLKFNNKEMQVVIEILKKELHYLCLKIKIRDIFKCRSIKVLITITTLWTII